LPRPDDHSDGASTLPTPELNPLLNPVLGQHMGRWAEVYFTSPPEKREQAVLELLRELRGENPELESATGAPAPTILQPEEQASVRCDACGRENPASHKFCGMCGTLMAAAIANHGAASAHGTADLHVSDLHVSDVQVSDVHVEDLPPEDRAFMRNSVGRGGQSQFVPEEAVYEPVLSKNELRIFRDEGEDKYRDDFRGGMFASSAPRPAYRVYLGIALAVLIFAVAYIAWRSTQSTLRTAHVAPQAPPAIATPTEAPAPTPSLTTNDAAAPTTSSGAPSAGASAPVATAPDASAPRDRPAATTPADAASTLARASTVRRKPAPAEPPASSATEATTGNGAEELAMAQRYLDGTDGQAQNRAEAAKWLWKAVGKHNAQATLLLADLFLKGEGVPKNCDQARVLLDSATRGGMKEAGERLRHLQAFGCQ
jgi:TPR repeat protein